LRSRSKALRRSATRSVRPLASSAVRAAPTVAIEGSSGDSWDMDPPRPRQRAYDSLGPMGQLAKAERATSSTVGSDGVLDSGTGVAWIDEFLSGSGFRAVSIRWVPGSEDIGAGTAAAFAVGAVTISPVAGRARTRGRGKGMGTPDISGCAGFCFTLPVASMYQHLR